MSTSNSPIVAKIDSKTTPFGFEIQIFTALHQNSYLATEHEGKTFILGIQKLWNDKNGSFAKVNVIGQIPSTPFEMDAQINLATPDQIKIALGLVEPDKGLYMGQILHSNIPANLNLEKLGRVFITGKSGSGKSYTVGVLIEELMKKQIPTIIIDRHGEYSALKILQKDNIPEEETFFGSENDNTSYTNGIIEFGDPQMNPGVDLQLEYLMACQMQDLIIPGQCIIINLRGVDIPIQENIIEQICARIYKASTLREIPPHFIFIDEAHLFAGKKKTTTVDTLKLIAQEGRKFGSNLVVITQKPQALDTTIRAQAGTWIIHKLTDINDVKITCNSAEGLNNDADEEIQNLAPGEAIVTGDITPNCPLRLQIRLRYTVHGGAGYNILDHMNEGQNVPKAQLVENLRQNFSSDVLQQATEDVMSGKKFSVIELYGQIDALRQENIELRQEIADLKATSLSSPTSTSSSKIQSDSPNLSSNIISGLDINKITEIMKTNEDLINEKEDLIAQLQTMQLVELEVEELKRKYNTEQKRADDAVALAEKALKKLRKQKKP